MKITRWLSSFFAPTPPAPQPTPTPTPRPRMAPDALRLGVYDLTVDANGASVTLGGMKVGR